MARATGAVEPVAFRPVPEWAQTTRLHFEVTGFNFAGDPELKSGKRTPLPDEPPLHVAALLAESAAGEPCAVPLVFHPIVWDEVEEAVKQEPPAVAMLAAALELYEPPAAAEPEPFPSPAQAGLLPYEKPALRRPPTARPAVNVEPMVPRGSRIHLPVASLLPLRPVLILGPSPEPCIPPTGNKVELAIEVPSPERCAPPTGNKVEVAIEVPLESDRQIGADITTPAEVNDEAPLTPTAAEQERHSNQEPAEEEVKASREESTTSLQPGSSEAAAPIFTPAGGMGTGARMGMVAAALVAAGGIALFIMGGSSTKSGPAAVTQMAAGAVETTGPVMGVAGWSTDHTLDSQGKRIRQLSFYRPSMQVSDYRVEFQAVLENKAVSWVVRATSSKTHYVVKLAQIAGPGDVRLVRFPMMDGRPGETVTRKLPFPAHAEMTYRVRTDVVGSRFIITVNDKLADEWKDDRMLSGGFGVANEGAERGQIQAIQIWHLRDRPPVRR